VPGGRGLAVYVALNLEQYSFGEGIVEALVPGGHSPDVANFSWLEYGNRVGAWRLRDLFRELSLPCTLLLNSAVAEHCPDLVAAFAADDAEIAAHGRTNSERQGELPEHDECALILDATETIARCTGVRPKGWLGPWISESHVTPDLLHEAGYSYVLDWCADDQPVWMSTRRGRILSVPYPQELNDSSAIIGRFVSPSDFADMIVDNFDEIVEQSQEQSLVMGIALHAHCIGQPFRLRQLRRALAHIASARERVCLTTAGAIAAHYAGLSETEPGPAIPRVEKLRPVPRTAGTEGIART